MSKLRCHISISLDGFVAGPNQSEENPLGEGGERLHDWVVELAAWRQAHGADGGEVNESTRIVEESVENVGAGVMGRNMFGPVGGGPWGDGQWTGWWGDNPPYHYPVFVVTHYARDPVAMEGGTTFHFVTEGIESALDQARKAAGGNDVLLWGGGHIIQQYLAAGLLWTNAGYEESGFEDVFYHDVPRALAAEARRRERGEDSKALREPWPLEAWPVVPTRYLLCRDDRRHSLTARRNAKSCEPDGPQDLTRRLDRVGGAVSGYDAELHGSSFQVSGRSTRQRPRHGTSASAQSTSCSTLAP